MSDQGTIELLKHSTGSSLNRAIQHLDKCPVRETVKIGVVYVGLRQKHQRDILHNSNSKPTGQPANRTTGQPDNRTTGLPDPPLVGNGRSEEFEQFVGALGWPVDLSTHKGFSGGLDCNADKLSCEYPLIHPELES